MSRLLVVTAAPGGGLHGVLADAQRAEGGAQVFYRDLVEVARVPAGGPLVVRDIAARSRTIQAKSA